MSNGDAIRTNLEGQYETLLPLLRYFKARLKYDTIRWLRTFGAKDDIIFSTRIKTFDRIYDKILRKGVRLNKSTELLDIILSGEGVLDDTVGIRFVCFDAHHVVRLVSHFVTTERVRISNRECYVSQRVPPNNPLLLFLRANGFKSEAKEGREYEDVTFILRFAHPIDLYFESDASDFRTFGERIETAEAGYGVQRREPLKRMFDQIAHGDTASLIGVIPKFPIECQIVTATQHIYNRSQRPLYESVIQKTSGDDSDSYLNVQEVERTLSLLKVNLIAVEQATASIFDKYGIRYDAIPTSPGAAYDLTGRIPAGPESVIAPLVEVNEFALPGILDRNLALHKRMAMQKEGLRLLDLASSEFSKVAGSDAGGIDRHLLDISEIPRLDSWGVTYWSLQRIAILEVLNVLLFSNNSKINEKMLTYFSKIQGVLSDNKKRDSDSESVDLYNPDLVIRRLFERLKHMDGAVTAKLKGRSIFEDLDEFSVNPCAFTDPIISWRYATFMYVQREYVAAKREILIGLSQLTELDAGKKDAGVSLSLPEKAQFSRRLVEYEICNEIERLRYDISSMAGIFEACSALAIKTPAWVQVLDSVAQDAESFIEGARAVCWILLLRFCSVSAGGLRDRSDLAIELRPELDAFRRVETDARHRPNYNELEYKTWWLLSQAIAEPQVTSARVEAFRARINEIHHPVEKRQFERLCCSLIELWCSDDGPDPQKFNANSVRLLQEEFRQLKQVEGAGVEIQRLGEILKDLSDVWLRERAADKEARSSWRAKIGKIAADGAGKIAVETASAGLRALLGLQ